MKKTSPRPDPGGSASSKPKLLFVGEGPQDIGRDDERGGALAGFVHAVLRGSGSPVENHELPFEVADIRIWTRLQLTRPRKKRQSLDEILKLTPDGERVRAAMVLAATMGWDGVVVMRDCERADNIDLGNVLREARTVYTTKEPNPAARPALVVAAPSRCHETWLLADPEAARAVLDEQGAYHFSDNPEKRPHCDSLKQHLDDHAKRLHCENATVLRMLSFRARPAELRKRCPRCYPPFFLDVKSELQDRFQLTGEEEASGTNQT